MKILVTLKWCVDYRVRAHPSSDGKTLATERLKKAINPFDEIALEQAIQFREAGLAKHITIISIGSKNITEGLRYGLAMGADEAVALEASQELDSLQVAHTLSAWLDQHPHDLVLMGKQAIDSDHNQTGQMLASLKQWPQATFASKIELTDDLTTANVTQEVDGGLQMTKCELPAVITADLRLNTPRYPTLPKIMQAKRKPLKIEEIATYYQLKEATHTVVNYAKTPQNRQTTTVEDMEQLFELLHTKEGLL